MIFLAVKHQSFCNLTLSSPSLSPSLSWEGRHSSEISGTNFLVSTIISISGNKVSDNKVSHGEVKSSYCEYLLDVPFIFPYFPLNILNNVDTHSLYQLNQVPLIF